MSFQFAWVGPAETAFGPEHAREDEEVFAFSLEHTEGDFATLSIDIRTRGASTSPKGPISGCGSRRTASRCFSAG